jgi:hypothetical protein
VRHDKEIARKAGVPKWLRRYSWRYGKGIFHLLQTHKQNANVPMLDHGRDRAAKKLAAPLEPRVIIEGVPNAT